MRKRRFTEEQIALALRQAEAGDDDRIIPTRDSVRLAAELPNAILLVIPKAGHVPHEEQPYVFMEAVRKFVNTYPHQEITDA